MLPFLSKIFEKLMCARLDSDLKSYNIYVKINLAFVQIQKLQTQLFSKFLDFVYSSLDSKQSTIAVYQDFSKAFDTVNHNILMSKLLHNGITGVTQSWFGSYLSNGNNMSQ